MSSRGAFRGEPTAPAYGASKAGLNAMGQSLAKALWGDRSPVGETMFYSPRSVTVVGVAGDVRKSALQDDPPIVFYVPYAQHTRSYITFVARPEAPGAGACGRLRGV